MFCELPTLTLRYSVGLEPIRLQIYLLRQAGGAGEAGGEKKA